MWITNADFNKLTRAIMLWDESNAIAMLSHNKKVIVDDACRTLESLTEKKAKDNKRVAQYIAGKRAVDPTYAGNKPKPKMKDIETVEE